ncbi:ranBP-type and C3HC4-type zinc finger-containing protein 1-like isoform X1 [Rhinatrema bivittatum]|uniref:ranBP-type and C3HC4-type zinc finger-containing protein 1-like isoform X1 n=1 Tax=Rhinatrema bivittatum TaxID=194408 RepID=UPI001127A176|nr:ranBP-type and C3HC4-type zinc finger-containing protein 1-like isoform X1 [Rhinatrema bivittatum]
MALPPCQAPGVQSVPSEMPGGGGPHPQLPTVLMSVRVSAPPGTGGGGGEEAAMRLQLLMEPERAGEFRLTVRRAEPKGSGSTHVAEFNLKDISYEVKHPKCHALTVLSQQNASMTFNFEDEREAQKWWTVVSSSLREVQKVSSSSVVSPNHTLPPVPGNPFRIAGSAKMGASAVSVTGNPFGAPPAGGDASAALLGLSKKEDLAQRLCKAVEFGDHQIASQCAIALAQQKAPLQIQLKQSCFPQTEISMKVGVEDASCSANVTIKVQAYTTVAMLKQQVFQEYGFHPSVQRWIIGQCLCVDDRTLSSYGIRKDGDTAFLYLLSAKKANLSQLCYEEDQALAMMHPAPSVTLDSAGTDEKWKSCTLPSRLSPKKAPAARGNERSGKTDIFDISQLLNLDVLRLNNNHLPNTINSKPFQSTVAPPSPLPTGWSCPSCTYINKPTRPGCEMCSADRPQDYVIPGEYKPDERERWRLQQEKDGIRQYQQALEEERIQNFMHLLQMDDEVLVPNQEEIECRICFSEVYPGDGVLLRECLHSFCRECLRQVINCCEEPEVPCPFRDDSYACSSKLQEREIRALVSAEEYRKFLERGLTVAERRSENSYHCKTVDCRGWCIYEDSVNEFQCPICWKLNCLICKAIHEGMNCRQYQDDLRLRAQNDAAARQTNDMLKMLVQMGEAMYCPVCKIIVQKKDGCDWIRCTVCQTEICWVTKGSRWGPAGPGDNSGGCRCNINGRRCHPQCQNCH